MEWIDNIIRNMMLILAFICYLGVTVSLSITEIYMIKKRKKWEVIIPVFTLIVCIGITGIANYNSEYTNLKIYKVIREFDSQTLCINFLVDENQEVEEIGYAILNDRKERAYIDIEVEDGKIIKSGKKDDHYLEIAECIKTSKISLKGFTGNSKSYAELLEGKEGVTRNDMSWGIMAIRSAIILFPGVLLVLILIFTRLYRRKCNLLLKSKLKDLLIWKNTSLIY